MKKICFYKFSYLKLNGTIGFPKFLAFKIHVENIYRNQQNTV